MFRMSGAPRRRTGPKSPVPPAVACVALGAFAVWGFMTAARSSASFATHSVATAAVIERLRVSAPRPSTTGPSRFDEYADIRYSAHGRHERAEIVIAAGCVGECFPVYRLGETIHIAYDTQNGYVAYPAPHRGSGFDTSGMGALAVVAALFGVSCFVVVLGRLGRQPTARPRSIA